MIESLVYNMLLDSKLQYAIAECGVVGSDNFCNFLKQTIKKSHSLYAVIDLSNHGFGIVNHLNFTESSVRTV